MTMVMDVADLQDPAVLGQAVRNLEFIRRNNSVINFMPLRNNFVVPDFM